MKRQRQQTDVGAGLHSLPIELVAQIVRETRAPELRLWVALQRVSHHWKRAVDLYLEPDAVLQALLPSKLPSASITNLSREIELHEATLAMARSSARLFSLLGGAEWLARTKRYMYVDQSSYYCEPPKEFQALLEQAQRPTITLNLYSPELAGLEPHQQLALLLRQYALVHAARPARYAVAKVPSATVPLGQLYVHRPDATREHRADAPFVRAPDGTPLYLDSLRPLISERDPVLISECYDLRPASRPAGEADRYRGWSLIKRLEKSFADVYPLLRAQADAVAALGIALQAKTKSKKRRTAVKK